MVRKKSPLYIIQDNTMARPKKEVKEVEVEVVPTEVEAKVEVKDENPVSNQKF